MGYRIGYNGPKVDELLQKGYKYSVINNGWTKLESSDLAATNLDTLVTPGNYSTSFWQNGPIQLVTNGPINVCVTKDSSSNTLYQTIYDAGKIYIRSTTATTFSNTWKEEQNDSTLDIGATAPVNPSDNFIWIDTSGDAPIIKIYKESKGEWVAISAADLAKKSVYDKNNIGKSFTAYLEEKIAEGDLATAEDTYKKHIVEGEDTGNPIHVTSEEKLKWNAGISSTEADTLINNFKKEMQQYADSKVNTSSTKVNEISDDANAQKLIMDNHMGDSTIHLTADQVTAFDNKAAGDHTHLNDGTVTVSTTNLTGLIPIERLDPSVLERNYTVSSYDDLFNLTKNEVQNGDSVYVEGKSTDINKTSIVLSKGNMPSTQQWESVCYGDDKFVAISTRNSNVAAYSTDGITWTESTLPSNQSWWNVCYGNGKFVAVADGNISAYSTDGITWTESTLPIKTHGSSICYGNGKFVIVGQRTNKAAYSSDGITWSTSNLPSEQLWTSVCYGNDKFITVSYAITTSDSTSNIFAYSSDGINWIEYNAPSNQMWTSVCYGNGKFVTIVGEYASSSIFAYSTDGINWTQGNMPSEQEWASVYYGNNIFIAVAYSSDIFAYSTDGITWTENNLSSSKDWNAICYGADKFVLLAYASNTCDLISFTLPASHPSAWFVVDDSKLGEYELESWTTCTMPSSQNWQSVCYGNGKFVAITSSNIFAYSTDGINWTEGTIPNYIWRSVCYGNDKFVAVGDGIAIYSTDGITWTESTLPSNQSWRSVCYGNGKFVTVASNGSNLFAYSTDGINWTHGTFPISINTIRFTDTCYGNGKFIAIGTGDDPDYITNLFMYSDDGINWTQGSLPKSIIWSSICYGNDKFVITGYERENGITIMYSTDSINWVESNAPSNVSKLCIIRYGNGKFIALLSDYSDKFIYSMDAINWTQDTLPSKWYWQSVCYGNGKFVITPTNTHTIFLCSSLNKIPTALVQYAAPTPELTWDNITNKPTTISDYGLSNTYYTTEEIVALYNKYKSQYDEINKSVSDITDSLLEIPEDLSTTYDTNLARASALNKKLDDLLHSLGLNDQMISDMVNMYKERSIIYKKRWGYEFSKMTVGSTFTLGKYQVESEDPWDIEWEIVHQTDDYQIAMTKQIIDLRSFDGKESSNTDSNRKKYGNNNWSVSNIKQFLNSDQASWYSSQHQYDAPPSSDNVQQYSNGTTYIAYDTHKGFLYYWSDDEKSLLKDYTFTLANNTVTDGGGSYTWTGKVFLPTYTQMGGGQNNSISEGVAFSKFTDDTSRIKSLHDRVKANNEYAKLYNSTGNWWYWLSSAYPSNSYGVRIVYGGGSVSYDYNAYYGYLGLAPCICLPRTDVFFEINPEEYSVKVQYTYVNESGKELPKAVVQNKPTDTTVTLNYMYPEKSSQEVTIDDTHYPAGETIDAEDGSGYYTFEGWTSDDSKIDSES